SSGGDLDIAVAYHPSSRSTFFIPPLREIFAVKQHDRIRRMARGCDIWTGIDHGRRRPVERVLRPPGVDLSPRVSRAHRGNHCHDQLGSPDPSKRHARSPAPIAATIPTEPSLGNGAL